MKRKRRKLPVQELDTRFGRVRKGTEILITKLDDPFDDSYPGKTGTVKSIGRMGQLYGTWGFLEVIPDSDEFTIIRY